MDVRTVSIARARPPDHPEYFDGIVRMQDVHRPERDEPEMVAVFFESGARTRPHVHEVVQVLHVVSGRCVVVIEEERRIADVGEYVIVPGGVWHWHGATRDGPMCHVSIKLPGRTDWTVPVRDWDRG